MIGWNRIPRCATNLSPLACEIDPTPLQVRLVIIDTLSFHFRQPNLDMNSRRRAMDT